MFRTMRREEAEAFVLALLKESGPLTTAGIMEHSRNRGVQCPESTGSFLARLRFEGKIHATYLPERKTWLWR